ncbi:MAG TPA: M13-type metalloendopeptidase [Steroidobacteraceae bacterium]|nr:M13-type metalloendopeptidase [Steroidobacteraceae bacterium]
MPDTSRYAISLTVATAVLTVLAGCQRASEEKQAVAPAAWTLDESKLQQPIRFSATDLDPAQNACQDLGAYANSKWLAANEIPSDESGWGAFQILHNRSLGVRQQLAERIAGESNVTGIDKIIGDFWATGMDEQKLNEAGLEPLGSRLAAIDALTDGPSVAEYLRKVAAAGENPLFGFGPEPDFKDSTLNIAAAFQGGLGLPDSTYYSLADKKPIRDAYVKHIAKLFELAGTGATDAAKQGQTVLAFETRLAKASKSNEQLSRDVSLYYHPVKIAEADKLSPNFPWTKFFESQRVATPEWFSLGIPDFHREVSRMLAEVPVSQWKSWLRFKLLDDASPYLSDAFVNEHFDFYGKTLQGRKELRPRWKRVLGVIENSAGEAMGQRYVEVAFPASSKAQMLELVNNLRDALKARIENLSWMSDATKKKALEKWAAFNTKIGYPDKWRDWTGLETSRDSLYGNVAAAAAFNYRYELDKIGKPVDKDEWGMTPQTVNAYYNPQLNEIVFPAAILQPPFFDPQADAALNYGAIGAVIGHELTHGYDDQGSRFGPSGNFEQWWTDEDAKRFKALTGKLVAQYNGYDAAPGLTEKVNGNLTLGENIADLGGLNVAYDAFQKAVAGKPDPKIDGLTRDQRFFLGYAAAWREKYTPELTKLIVASDPHAPARVRASATPTNMDSFAKAFGCKEGDPMVNSGDKKVVIW